MLPDFVVVGAHKCATTSLHGLLDQHPGIAMTSVKEPHFLLGERFAHLRPPRVRDLATYEDLWSGALPGALRGEASVFYLNFPDEFLECLEAFDVRPRLVAVLRNPVDRAYSGYNDVGFKSSYEVVDNFDAVVERELSKEDITAVDPRRPAVSHIGLGFYASNVRRLIDAVGRENLHIVVMEDLVEDPHREIQRLIAFLGAEAVSGYPEGLEHRNEGGRRWRSHIVGAAFRSRMALVTRGWTKTRFPRLHQLLVSTATARFSERVEPMSPQTRHMLRDLYRSDILELQEVLSMDLSKWLKG